MYGALSINKYDKLIILNFKSSVLLAQLGQYWKNIGTTARVICKINSTNNAQPGRTILDALFLEIDIVCIMTRGGIYAEI